MENTTHSCSRPESFYRAAINFLCELLPQLRQQKGSFRSTRVNLDGESTTGSFRVEESERVPVRSFSIGRNSERQDFALLTPLRSRTPTKSEFSSDKIGNKILESLTSTVSPIKASSMRMTQGTPISITNRKPMSRIVINPKPLPLNMSKPDQATRNSVTKKSVPYIPLYPRATSRNIRHTTINLRLDNEPRMFSPSCLLYTSPSPRDS
eukprot:TRINITY_DN10676_c0_g1_i2.p1 TRINITY_DN10676_c0_g1~~TRINITY_DN10676_c0_g1_i2.p1  ORF type:complete len:209 (-),score=2.79 TRINITY_DN10676_c0_g1_i2:110-736(-)